MREIYRHFFCRAPTLPLECFHGNCYGDTVEVVREEGVIVGLKLKLIADGEFSQHGRGN